MGAVIDTVLVDLHNTSTNAAVLTAGTVTNSGDALGVRSFAPSAWAKLEALFLQGSSTRKARVTSARMHDNVTGLTFQSAESPTDFVLPRDVGEPLYSADVLTVSLDAAASSDTLAALLCYYSDVDGMAASLATWDQVKSSMIRLKTIEVDLTTSATIGAWTDTVITTTENQLKADYRYALLGFETNVALCAMGIKGPATSNLRICAPGATSTLDISSYFIEMGVRHGTPHIPVFKANDRASTNISACANTASVAANVYAVLAQLSG